MGTLSCQKDASNTEHADDPIEEQQELEEVDQLIDKDKQRLDSFKKANGITD